MQIHEIKHGFTYVYEKDALGRLRPALFDEQGTATQVSPTLFATSGRATFHNYTEARVFLNAHGDPRRSYYLSEVSY